METNTPAINAANTDQVNTKTDSENKKNEDQKNAGFWTLFVMMLIGILGMITISIFSCFATQPGLSSFWPVLGLSLIIALAAAVCGGFLGFLFGIPRSLQNKNSQPSTTITTPASTTAETAKAVPTQSTTTTTTERSYGNNTNLEEISDWLTKIIVGVSLTQLPAIESRFHQLTLSASGGFTAYFHASLSYPYAGALMVFFAICGFFAVYLWSRIYFFEILTRLEKTIGDLLKNEVKSQVESAISEKVDDKFAAQEKAALIKLWQDRKREFEKQRDRIIAAESAEIIKGIIEIAQPAPVTVLDDCQQNRWGGKTVAGGFEVSANFNQNPNESDYYDITLAVQPVAGSAAIIAGNVYFFLHDSFYPNIIVPVVPVNNRAEYNFSSFEAFTIGIVLNGGSVKLEINLNTYPPTPDGYKYKDESLFTYEQIKAELQKSEG